MTSVATINSYDLNLYQEQKITSLSSVLSDPHLVEYFYPKLVDISRSGSYSDYLNAILTCVNNYFDQWHESEIPYSKSILLSKIPDFIMVLCKEHHAFPIIDLWRQMQVQSQETDLYRLSTDQSILLDQLKQIKNEPNIGRFYISLIRGSEKFKQRYKERIITDITKRNEIIKELNRWFSESFYNLKENYVWDFYRNNKEKLFRIINLLFEGDLNFNLKSFFDPLKYNHIRI